MPQAPARRGNAAANLLANPEAKNLPSNVVIEKRADGSVWRIETVIKDKNAPGPDKIEQRVDSAQDRDSILRGEIPWYLNHLDPKPKSEKS